MFTLFLVVWVLCGIGTAGTLFAFFQGNFALIAKENYFGDLALSWFFGLMLGPLGLLIGALALQRWKYGWRLW